MVATGGTAGLVLANRLTEDANTSVLVVESGARCVFRPVVYLREFYVNAFACVASTAMLT